LTWYYRAADARWRAWFGRSLVTPRAIAIGTAIKLPVLGYVIWRLAVRPRLGPLDLSLLHVPVLAVGAALAVHAAWPYLRRARRIVGIALASAALAAIATSLVIWQLRPSLTLAIWGDSPIAGQAIDALFDLDEMRARVRL